jgi:citrate lyase beta subunit
MELHRTARPAPSLDDADLAAIDTLLAVDDERRAARYPGDDSSRQPIHTVYVPASRITTDLVRHWGSTARAVLNQHAPSASSFAEATERDPRAVAEVWPLVLTKLEREPIEDLRIDLEDGYGLHGDDQEDADVVAAVDTIGQAAAAGTGPPFWGVRVKCLEPATRRRGLRTLDLALATVLEHGPLPNGWIVTLPKVTSIDQVEAMVEISGRLEQAYELEPGRLRFEVQIETPQAILGAEGTATVARLIGAAAGRCAGLHFGTYDYSAALGVAGAYQAMDHPAADHAKAVMALAAAGTGVRLSDGSTNVLPVGDRTTVHAAWALHTRLVTRSLERAYYQGWDLHPAQLPTRFLATYLFFRRGLEPITGRLSTYLRGVEGAVLDEPATAQALAGFLLRGVHCGAVRKDEVESGTGVTLEDVESLARRRTT